eukprot:TRINITY_DN6551_c0_g1_i21.p6 TRINITY_DN6551_c0_g1~~TRINITY_DN6551_c0_g1_i21.p6  ORF type:complete len:154 (-),score=2.25 TRINITY_DN6551_c0_g1_i21:1030-1491(-)
MFAYQQYFLEEIVSVCLQVFVSASEGLPFFPILKQNLNKQTFLASLDFYIRKIVQNSLFGNIAIFVVFTMTSFLKSRYSFFRGDGLEKLISSFPELLWCKMNIFQSCCYQKYIRCKNGVRINKNVGTYYLDMFFQCCTEAANLRYVCNSTTNM